MPDRTISAGLGWEWDEFSATELQVTHQFLMNKALSIGGGTTEVQMNLVAKAIGLPQGKGANDCVTSTQTKSILSLGFLCSR